MKILHKLLIAFTSLTIAACGPSAGTSTGNGLAMSATSGTQPLVASPPAADLQGTEFSLSTVRAYVRHVEFDLPSGTVCADVEDAVDPTTLCNDSGSSGSSTITLEGPFVFDLLNKTSTPPLDTIQLPAATYKRIDVRFDDALVSDGLVTSTDPLADNTLVAAGDFTYNGTAHTFDLALKFNEDARFESVDGVTLEENLAATILLNLDVDDWFSATPITQCIDDGDLTLTGTHLLIEDSSGGCSGIENGIKEAIKLSGQLDKL